LVRNIADVSRQEATCALLIHFGTRRHAINSNQHHTPAISQTAINSIQRDSNYSDQHHTPAFNPKKAARTAAGMAEAVGNPSIVNYWCNM
jgi:hypothetical protein